MLKNYFNTAWRNLVKNRTFSLINIVGLSVGIAACLMILEYVSYEMSFDQFNKNAENIYRVVNDRYQNGKLIQHGTITYSAIGKAMQDDFPEVINHCRVEPDRQSVVSYGETKIDEQNVLAVDNSFLTMFTYPLLAGDPHTALLEPRSMVLSRTLAEKLFNISNDDFTSVIGKEVVFNKESESYRVTGICKDVPANSHLQFDLLFSYVTIYSGKNAWKQADYDFTDSDFWHYIQLKPGTDYKALEGKFSSFSERHFHGSKVSGSVEKFYLQPLLDAHLYSDFEYEIGNTGNGTIVWGLLIIAMLIILIAWINYINLTTAKSIERAKEVGIRKASGATKNQLISQFLSESFIIKIIAIFIALAIVLSLQNIFNDLIHLKLSISWIFKEGFKDFNLTLLIFLLMIAGIFISGFYPAFILSAFKPILVLKGKYSTSAKGVFLRKLLVVGQFAVTVVLIIGASVVYRQMHYVNEKDLGFNMSQMLIIKGPQLTEWDSTFITRQNAFMNEVKRLPHVLGTAFSMRLPGDELSRSFDVHRAYAGSQMHLTMRNNGISKDFINLYKMKMVAGRNFLNTDYNPEWSKLHNVIINENAAQLLGFKSAEDAVGKQIISGHKKWDIVGIVADFHQKSLRYAIEPTIFIPASSTSCPISIKANTANLKSTIAALKNIYSSFFPGNVFDYYFLDKAFNRQYANDRLFENVFAILSALAIFIACLGLLGLSLLTISQRTKEIGIRKVLGATGSNIVFLLSKDFIKLVIIAFVIASPIAWIIMQSWLRNFVYHINISGWTFFLSGSLALTIAFATICLHAIKAARSNPVKSLRYE